MISTVTITKRTRRLAGLAVVAVLAGCSTDGTSSPAEPSIPAMSIAAPLPPSEVLRIAIPAQEVQRPAEAGAVSTFLNTTAATTSYSLTVDPTKTQSFIFGVHMVVFPANTICDPTESSYGPGTWLTSCVKADDKISMTAKTWIDAQGRARIDFSTALRFYPNSNGALPSLYLRDPAASLSLYSRIDYCTTTTSTSCVNEAATDPVLKTQRESTTGYLFRIIRHFSGYNVWA